MSTVKTEDAEDHEIFDINDFTTASDWERYYFIFLIINIRHRLSKIL